MLTKEAICSTSVPCNDLDALFALCNCRYFNRAIQPSAGFKLQFSRSRKLFGFFTYCLETHTDWSIHMAGWLTDHPLAALNTMTHEMIHMLAHQRFRESGDPYYLDHRSLPGHPFTNKGHGAFFLTEMQRLNDHFPELQLAVKSELNATLFDHSKIAPARLLLVTIDSEEDRGMIYRLHDKALPDWHTLRQTAQQLHGLSTTLNRLALIMVAGHHADGFPLLKKNNQAPVNMVPVRLRNYRRKMQSLLGDAQTSIITENTMTA